MVSVSDETLQAKNNTPIAEALDLANPEDKPHLLIMQIWLSRKTHPETFGLEIMYIPKYYVIGLIKGMGGCNGYITNPTHW